MITYKESGFAVNLIESRLKALSTEMRIKYDDLRGPMGLVPDSVRESADYQDLKNRFAETFQQLRNVNTFINKHYKAELKAERKAKLKGVAA